MANEAASSLADRTRLPEASLVSEEVAAGRWFRRAAEAGHLEAKFFLGLMHLNGVGMEKSAVRAAAWFERAAEQGHAGAQYQLGRARMRGQGTLRDEAEGLE